ncbi:hypothetical protein TL16_g06474 [Triparma laevis f. inornata]|uniref:Uncharacterized protein n=1 Tax=Triparma laevis f. inornata TaxID=1714386 RepID=A0A9W7ASU9_9STRA|nr:hypothetical protein TL16_g06474 [Triparma laevis f. inornata]
MWSGLSARPSLDSAASVSGSGSFAYTPSNSLDSASTVTVYARGDQPKPRPSRKTFSAVQKSNQSPQELLEHLRIQQSFSATSFNSMRSLPSNLKNGSVSRVMSDQLRKVKEQKYTGPKKKFSPMPNMFSYPAHEFNGEPATDNPNASFLSRRGGEKGLKPFLPSGSARALKHESLMPQPKAPSTYPYSSSPYDEANRYWQEQKQIDNSKILHGEFKSSGVQKVNSEKISYLPTIAKLLYKKILADWESSNFEVLTM